MKAGRIKNRKVYLTVMFILLAVILTCEVIVAKKYMEQKLEKWLYSVYWTNDHYKGWLSVWGYYGVSIHGVEYPEGKTIDYDTLYEKIAFIRVFNKKVSYEYDDISILLAEYDTFCETGNESEIIEKFSNDFSDAEQAACDIEYDLRLDRISYVIYLIREGDICISNNEVARVENDSPEFDEEYLQMVDSVNGDEGLAACMYYEKHSDLLNAWLKENGSGLREVND